MFTKNEIANLRDEKISLAKLMIYLSFFLFLGGMVLDYFSAPEMITELIKIRLATSALLASVLIVINIKPNFFIKYYDWFTSLIFISCSMSVIYMIYLTNSDSLSHSTYFAGLVLILITVFLGSYIPTSLSIIIAILIISTFSAVAYSIRMDFNLAANNTFFLVSGLTIGIVLNALKTSQLAQILLLQDSLKESLRDQYKETARQTELANRDVVTGIPNRYYGSKILEKMLDNGSKLNMLTVIYFIDINDFKQINDTHGHYVGDEVLRITASRLSNIGRKSDLYMRQGGDEFIYAVQIEKDSTDFIEKCEAELRNKISPIIVVQELRLRISASIGYSVAPMNSENIDELIRIADENMYKDKNRIKANHDYPVGTLEVPEQDVYNPVIIPLSKYRNK